MVSFELFLELVRVAIGKAERLSKTPDEQEWRQLLEEANRQTVVGVIFPALERLQAEQRPPKSILLNWHNAKERIVQKNEKTNRDAVTISRKFRKVNFRNVIIKGQGNALLYPDPSLRMPGDIDVWLEGDQDMILNYVHRLFPKEKVQSLEIRFPVLRETEVEVHTSPNIMFDPFDNRRLQRYFAKHAEEMFCNEVMLPDGPICIPTWDVNIVFQLTHIYRHLFTEGTGLRQVMDYYYLLKAIDKEENASAKKADALDMISRLHMAKFCGALMWVLQYVFCLEDKYLLMPADEKEGRFLLEEIHLAGNFGMFDERNTKRKKSKWSNFWHKTLRNGRFLTRYPREVIWNPIFRIQQYAWRVRHGYN